MSVRETYEYNRLTWPEMNDAIEMQKVVILPTGSTEQHGPHMPLDVDLFLATSVCHELGRRAPEEFDPVWHHRVRSHLDLDLKPYFPHGPIPFTRAFVSDGDGAELDDTMARRIGIEHVRLIPGHSHAGLARAMREEGWFERLYP